MSIERGIRARCDHARGALRRAPVVLAGPGGHPDRQKHEHRSLRRLPRVRWPWSKPNLADPNVPADWIEQRAWLAWEAPRNLVAGEASYLAALARIAGQPCDEGYCFPTPVMFIREPTNAYDGNALRAEVGGELVGYLRRALAANLAGPLDQVRCSSFGVAGLIRGGSTTAPNLGCHVWIDRRVTPGPKIELDMDDEWSVAWPPHGGELAAGTSRSV